MWKDIYVIGRLWKLRFIVRNQWHEFSNYGFYLFELGKTAHRNRKEFVLTIIGFQLAIFYYQ